MRRRLLGDQVAPGRRVNLLLQRPRQTVHANQVAHLLADPQRQLRLVMRRGPISHSAHVRDVFDLSVTLDDAVDLPPGLGAQSEVEQRAGALHRR